MNLSRLKRIQGSSRVFFAIALSLGLLALLIVPRLGGVKASSLTFISDTISRSSPGLSANHTVNFTLPNGVLPGATIVLTFPSGFDLSAIGTAEFDVASTSGDYDVATTTTGTTWGVDVTGQVITLTNGTMTVASGTALSVQIGSHATHNVQGFERIINHSTPDSYVITIGGTIADSGATRIVIVSDVVMTASVNTSLTFEVAGVAIGASVNGSPTTTSTTTSATSIPFGLLSVNQSKVAAQDLTVVTNADNGFVVTVHQDQNLTASTGGDIDTFIDGLNTPSPTGWVAPSANPAQEATFGHFGLTSEDDLNTNEFGADLWAGNFTVAAPRAVFSHTGAADGITPNIGKTRVGYQIQITALQEAGNDYTNTLTYIVTPSF